MVSDPKVTVFCRLADPTTDWRLASSELYRQLDHLSTLVCGYDPITTRARPDHNLYRTYLKCFDHIFYKSSSIKQEFQDRINSPLWRKIHCEHRERAWNACNDCDLQASGVVLRDTKMKWQEWPGEDAFITNCCKEMEDYRSSSMD